MEIKRYVAPFDYQEVFNLWTETFGIDEALLEKPQVDGQEKDFNTDVVYLAKENGNLLGAIHLTQPRSCPEIIGLSGMCTTPSARGKGLGRILFQKIVEEADALGGKVAFLGTNNPVAAKLYHSLGFAFVSGSNVMARYVDGDLVDFTKRAFSTPPASITVKKGDPSARIPIIPLVLNLTEQYLLDVNAKIFSREFITQRSCMGLFPRYIDIRKNGGEFFIATAPDGVLGGISSVVKTDKGFRADLFYADNFSSCAPKLVKECEREFGNVYFELSLKDQQKRTFVESLGYKQMEKSTLNIDELFSISTLIYKK